MIEQTKYVHPVSGEIKPLTKDEFLALFDPSVHDVIQDAIDHYPDCEAVVCFENLDMSSSHLGERTALVVGPSNTYTLEALTHGGQLGSVPSQFKYPVSYYKTS